MMGNVSAACLFFCCFNLLAQSPNPRRLEEVVFDQGHSKLIVLGGAEITSSGFSEPADISEWDGIEWKSILQKEPVGRREHALVFDVSELKVFFIGGVTIWPLDS